VWGQYLADELDNLWTQAYGALHDQVSNVRFDLTLLALREAVECQKVNCTLAASIMCRNTIESVLFALHQWQRKRPAQIALGWDQRRRIRSLIKWAKGNGVLTDRQVKKAEEIVEQGDFAAHFEERVSEERLRHGTQGESYRVDLGSQEALHTIKDTIKLLTAIPDASYVKNRLNSKCRN